MPERQTTPIDRIHDALIDKQYRRLDVFNIKGDHHTERFALYANRGQYVLMQEHRNGGCELFTPLTDSHLIDKTIEAIP